MSEYVPMPPAADAGPDSLFSEALAAGTPVITDADYPLDAKAVRLLPTDEFDGLQAVAVAVAGDVLAVVCPALPSPAQFRAMEAAAGALVTVAVAPASVFDAIRARAEQMRTGGLAPEAAHGAAPQEAGPLVLSEVLAAANAKKASDVHLSTAGHPVLRIDGALVKLDGYAPLSTADMESSARWMLGDDWAASGEAEAAITAAGARWRVSCYRQRGATAMALRRLPARIPRLEDLGLPAVVASLSSLTGGLVLFCGPTGSGKSTSLAALIGQINRTRAVHILTIEDPVEYRHDSVNSIVHQRELGSDTSGFDVALRAALRQDPDVIMVGEMRDVETMRTALQAAETGHLVLSTVHAGTADEVISRILDAFPPSERDAVRTQLASSLRAVVVQRLLPARPSGRALACEVMISTPAIRTCIREDRLHELRSLLDTSRGQGMSTMDRALATLVADGVVDHSHAALHAPDPAAFAEYISHLGGGTFTAEGGR